MEFELVGGVASGLIFGLLAYLLWFTHQGISCGNEISMFFKIVSAAIALGIVFAVIPW